MLVRRVAITGAAVGAAGLAALGLAGCTSGVDYRTDSYTFQQPGTDFVDPSRVLVRDGAVTDVWISADDKGREHYGYSPRTPASAAENADASSVKREGGNVTVCAEPGTASEWCFEFEDVHPLADSDANAMAAWGGLADGTYSVTSRSVTWNGPTTSTVTFDGDDVRGAGGDTGWVAVARDGTTPPHDWVRYWVEGESAPFAVCVDLPNSYDEETCWTWKRVPG